MRVEFFQVASEREVETTYLGMLFILSEKAFPFPFSPGSPPASFTSLQFSSSVRVGQAPAKIS
jgi:hypothetical protein